MSAYIVDKDHIIYLIAVAMSNRLSRHEGDSMSWNYGKEEGPKYLHNTEELASLVVIGQMLWNENVKSVQARYHGEPVKDLPGRVDDTESGCILTEADFVNMGLVKVDPIQVIKSCHCYEYQSCEHTDWDKSEACDFIQRLVRKAECAIEGYEQAEWGYPKKVKPVDYAAQARKEMKAAFVKSHFELRLVTE